MNLNYRPILRDAGVGEGGGGGAVPALDLNILPEDIRREPSLQNIKTIPDLAKGYVHSQKLIGANRIALPGANAGETEWNDFFQKIGRPDTADKYELPKIEGMDQSLVPDEKKLKEVRELFHKQGLTTKQANAVMEYYMKSTDAAVKGQRTSMETANTQAITDLKSEWGANFDSNLDIAKSVVSKFGDEKLLQYLDQSGMGSNTTLVKLLHKVGMAMLDDTQRGGGAGAELNLTDQSRAATEIERLKTDKDFQEALMKPSHPGHKAAVSRWTNLFAAAHPGQQET